MSGISNPSKFVFIKKDTPDNWYALAPFNDAEVQEWSEKGYTELK